MFNSYLFPGVFIMAASLSPLVWSWKNPIFNGFFDAFSDSASEGVTDKPILDCCACGTAKYRLTFYGNWSEKTHPKDFPREYPSLACTTQGPWGGLERVVWHSITYLQLSRVNDDMHGILLALSIENQWVFLHCTLPAHSIDWPDILS